MIENKEIFGPSLWTLLQDGLEHFHWQHTVGLYHRKYYLTGLFPIEVIKLNWVSIPCCLFFFSLVRWSWYQCQIKHCCLTALETFKIVHTWLDQTVLYASRLNCLLRKTKWVTWLRKILYLSLVSHTLLETDCVKSRIPSFSRFCWSNVPAVCFIHETSFVSHATKIWGRLWNIAVVST